MMNFNEALSVPPIDEPKVETTHLASNTVETFCRIHRLPATFYAVRPNLSVASLVEENLTVNIGLNAASYVKVEQPPDSEQSPDRSTFNSGATGTRALYDLLQEAGYQVSAAVTLLAVRAYIFPSPHLSELSLVDHIP